MNLENIIKLIHMLGLKKIRVSGNSVMTNCPFAPYLHEKGKDIRPSFGIKIDVESVYNCFACGVKGRLKSLLFSLSYYTNNYDYKISEFINLNDYEPNFMSDTDAIKKPNITTLIAAYQSFEPATPQLHLTEKDILKWELKYDKTNNAIVFPIFNEDGQLQALKGRRINEKAFFFYDGSANVKKLGIWYGMHLKEITRKKIILCEGERDAILLSRYGITVWASLGSSITKEQLAAVKKSHHEFVLFFDNDKAGIDATKKIVSECKLFVKLYRITNYSDCNDPAEIVANNKLVKALTSIENIN